MKDLNTILRLDVSPRKTTSKSRASTDMVIDHLSGLGAITVKSSDISGGFPVVDEDWVKANFTPAEQRTMAQSATLELSDSLINDLKDADTIVIGTPVYNFAVPAALKSWIDMVARARVTFRYTENGPVGLLTGKRAIILVASGGTVIGSEYDFVTPYLRHMLGFMGITDVTFIAAGDGAQEQITQLTTAKPA